jgi:hypothetical protein
MAFAARALKKTEAVWVAGFAVTVQAVLEAVVQTRVVGGLGAVRVVAEAEKFRVVGAVQALGRAVAAAVLGLVLAVD